ncbi:MAG: hypothetical protein IKS55_12550 [Oscillospiraceae bacterium]|nr:hypothetical protein [Oscillospiraceae bacterium]
MSNNLQIELASSHSMRVSLLSIANGSAWLNQKRQNMLSRAPEPGDWSRFSLGALEMEDLAYLTAATGHEFAILRGKNDDFLFHGSSRGCQFCDELEQMLKSHHVEIYGHSHPGEERPIPSKEDRNALLQLGQKSSRLISGLSGKIYEFTADEFEL